MTEPFVGEIRPVGFSFAPEGWAMCNGQLLAISQNTALFSLLGTNYGGDGRATFGLPDLRGRFPVHSNNGSGGPGVSGVQIGEHGGETSVTLTTATMPAHQHVPQGSGGIGTVNSPAGGVWAEAHIGRGIELMYATSGGTVPMSSQIVGTTGNGQPHNNMPPYLTLNFIIAMQGVFPARN